MCPLQDVKQSGLEATLLVDPVNDIAIRGVAADGFAQELFDTSIIIRMMAVMIIGCCVPAMLSPISNSSVDQKIIILSSKLAANLALSYTSRYQNASHYCKRY